MGKKDKEKDRDRHDVEVAPKNDRSADSMFRVVTANHFRLSQMADNKAHIMITICAGIIGLSIRQLWDPQLMYATMTMIAASLVAMLFAVYATMPKLGSDRNPDPNDPTFNIVFFSNFVQMPYERFEAEMENILHDRAKIHRSMIKDLYSLGKVLAEKKYRYLRFCYQTFLAGLVISAIVLAVSFLVLPRP